MKVQITIRGQQYTVRSDEDDVDPREVAAYVDARMAEIVARTSTADPYTVAMLAAMNIASDFERFRRQVDADLASLDRTLASSTLGLEAALPASDDETDDGES